MVLKIVFEYKLSNAQVISRNIEDAIFRCYLSVQFEMKTKPSADNNPIHNFSFTDKRHLKLNQFHLFLFPVDFLAFNRQRKREGKKFCGAGIYTLNI